MEPAPPQMEPGPPKVIEAIVGLLTPPACREHVLGDLHERYASPRQYIVDAVSTLPLVILSRIRRATDPQVLLMEAFALYVSFLVAARQLRSMSFLREEQGFLRLAIPTVMALVALMLADAYAHPGKRSLLKPVLEATLGVAFATLSQAALLATYSDLVVPAWVMMSGCGLSVLLVAALRLLFPPGGHRPRGAT